MNDLQKGYIVLVIIIAGALWFGTTIKTFGGFIWLFCVFIWGFNIGLCWK